MGVKAQPQERWAQGGHTKQNPERAQFIRAQVFAEAVRTCRTAAADRGYSRSVG
jgi:hypothetical protein